MTDIQETEDLRRRLEAVRSPEEGPTRAKQSDYREPVSAERIADLYQHQQQLIAYQIHDGVVQKATPALLQFEVFQALPGRDAERAQKALDSTMQSLRQSIEQARRLIAGMCPSMLEEGGLIPAMCHLVSEAQTLGGPKIELSFRVRFDRLIPPLEHSAFRIIQECLRNAQRHSEMAPV